ncbi:amino acid ABC transporter permease [Kaistia nematophila]|uniref:Amino acid ABC transporter permease n=1 Tax=Kaistia nematophila TaxID=2994654 RepID=A0A9X3E8E9_9HYPH|nr:amino acid ABC transporter permease [Kaistia nematophila]MCX5571363.1 amino acid ABC transporter permease [Kaistia nematophila]
MNYSFDFVPIWRNFDTLLYGLGIGLSLAALSILIGIVIGGVVAFGLVSKNKPTAWIAGLYVSFIRNIPILLVIFFMFFALPQLGIRFSKITSFVAALSIYAGANLAEVFRGGLQAIPKGMTEAGLAVGLRPMQIRLSIIIPLMLRSTLPSMGNAFISLFKDTSLAAAIAVPELTFYARKINVESFRIIETWIVTSLLYVAATFTIASLLRLVEARLVIKR